MGSIINQSLRLRCQKKRNEWGLSFFNDPFLWNGRPSKIRLLQCDVVLWIHVIDAICMLDDTLAGLMAEPAELRLFQKQAGWQSVVAGENLRL